MQSKEGTKTSRGWNHKSGNMDKLNLSIPMETEKEYGFPIILPQTFIPEDLILYKTEVKRGLAPEGHCVHFFTHDYVFEPLWNRPIQTLPVIKRVGMALSPDFSLYTDMPRVAQMWNIYRSRWLGRYWQDNGVLVIPSVTWGDESTYDFCFKGLPKNSPVAISTVGIYKEDREGFILGFEEMIKQLEPSFLIWTGVKQPVKFDDYLPNKRYETFWEKRDKAIAKKKAKEK